VASRKRVRVSPFGPRLALSGRDGLCRSRLEGPILKSRGPALHFALPIHESVVLLSDAIMYQVHVKFTAGVVK
jgi:hypothetical protein